jgi:hypothetical protein
MLALYPHLGHYIFQLLASVQPSPPRANQHPLSVSSSGESDGSDEDANENGAQATPNGSETAHDGGGGGTVQATPLSKLSQGTTGKGFDREAMVRRIVELLDNEEEEMVKDILRPHMGNLGQASRKPGSDGAAAD